MDESLWQSVTFAVKTSRSRPRGGKNGDRNSSKRRTRHCRVLLAAPRAALVREHCEARIIGEHGQVAETAVQSLFFEVVTVELGDLHDVVAHANAVLEHKGREPVAVDEHDPLN